MGPIVGKKVWIRQKIRIRIRRPFVDHLSTIWRPFGNLYRSSRCLSARISTRIGHPLEAYAVSESATKITTKMVFSHRHSKWTDCRTYANMSFSGLWRQHSSLCLTLNSNIFAKLIILFTKRYKTFRIYDIYFCIKPKVMGKTFFLIFFRDCFGFRRENLETN